MLLLWTCILLYIIKESGIISHTAAAEKNQGISQKRFRLITTLAVMFGQENKDFLLNLAFFYIYRHSVLSFKDSSVWLEIAVTRAGEQVNYFRPSARVHKQY